MNLFMSVAVSLKYVIMQQIVELQKKHANCIWNTTCTLDITTNYRYIERIWIIRFNLDNLYLNYLTAHRPTLWCKFWQAEPFARHRSQTSLPDDFEGYIIDLLDIVSRNTSIDFTVKAVADGRYGTLEGGHWNGMIGELKNNVSDLAILSEAFRFLARV